MATFCFMTGFFLSSISVSKISIVAKWVFISSSGGLFFMVFKARFKSDVDICVIKLKSLLKLFFNRIHSSAFICIKESDYKNRLTRI